jgi:hypothetical protein
MKSSEEIPRRDRYMHPLAKALDYAFGCKHPNLSRVFTIGGRTYQVCCECGAELDYSLQGMSTVRRSALRPALRDLRIRHI